MKNPVRTEAEAFRLVWFVIGYLGLIVLGSLVSRWVGLGVFVVLTLAVVWWLATRKGDAAPTRQRSSGSPEGEHRILVVANETVGGRELLDCIRVRTDAAGNAQVRVVCPALNSPLRHWASDEDAARDAAQERLDASLRAMRAEGVDADGEIGDGDPIQAIEDALRTFRPDELIVSTHPPGRSHWLERGAVEKIRDRFDLPVTHVTVDAP
jgi:hypothetical protein